MPDALHALDVLCHSAAVRATQASRLPAHPRVEERSQDGARKVQHDVDAGVAAHEDGHPEE